MNEKCPHLFILTLTLGTKVDCMQKITQENSAFNYFRSCKRLHFISVKNKLSANYVNRFVFVRICWSQIVLFYFFVWAVLSMVFFFPKQRVLTLLKNVYLAWFLCKIQCAVVFSLREFD